MSKTVLVIIDAFRSDYLNEENTPFLHSLIENGLYFRKLEPSFGFCERTEILVGEESDSLGYFSAIGFNPEESPYASIGLALSLLSPVFDRLPLLGQRIVKRLLWEVMSRKKGGFPPLSIPFNQLSHFALTEDGLSSAITEDSRSILNIVKAKGWGVNLDSFTSLDSKQVGDDSWRCSRLVEVIDSNDKLYLLYVGDCDKHGHVLGPDSIEFKRELKIVDQRLRQLYDDVNKKQDDVNFVFCGDHGMTEVRSSVNISEAVLSVLRDFIYGKDYIFFVDSTVFRIWVTAPSNMGVISEVLEELFGRPEFVEFGYLTTAELLGIVGGRLYGDWLWVANPGVVISPDFFNPKIKKIKGMHGYELHESSYGMGLCVGPAFSKGVIGNQKLTVIYDALKTALHI